MSKDQTQRDHLTIFGDYSVEDTNHQLLQGGRGGVANGKVLGILKRGAYLKNDSQCIATDFGRVILY